MWDCRGGGGRFRGLCRNAGPHPSAASIPCPFLDEGEDFWSWSLFVLLDIPIHALVSDPCFDIPILLDIPIRALVSNPSFDVPFPIRILIFHSFSLPSLLYSPFCLSSFPVERFHPLFSPLLSMDVIEHVKRYRVLHLLHTSGHISAIL